MNILRATHWEPGLQPRPLTTVTRASDLNDSIENALEALMQPGVLMTSDIFDIPERRVAARSGRRGFIREVSIEDATTVAMQRMGERGDTEHKMAIGYYYWAAALAVLTPQGTVVSDKPAPLGAEDLEVVLRQLTQHPSYQHQDIVTISHDLEVVTLKAGLVERLHIGHQGS